jgi:hypothetical protein
LGGKLIYEINVFLGYQRIMDPKGIQTLEGRRNKKKKGFCEGGNWRCAS